MKKGIIIIGSGFSSISAACYLTKAGNIVKVLEKNDTLGGRARQLKKNGFTFDIGPSWYWMPDVFENFFGDFDRKVNDYYTLEKLDPAYEVYFDQLDSVKIGDSLEKIYDTFEAIEAGSSIKLKKYIKKAEDNYEIAVKDLVYRPGVSPLELVTLAAAKRIRYFLTTIKGEVTREFKNPRLAQILQFPVLFLGAKPEDTPAFYNFMNFADFGLGTWYPKGGMYSVVLGMVKMAEELKVQFSTNQVVESICVNEGKVTGVIANGIEHKADVVISGADYHHSESLLNPKYRVYSERYWDKKIFAPSSLLFFIGFDKKIKNVSHHTLFFDVDFDAHTKSIYDTPEWPEAPMFYASFSSITDSSVAPKGKESCVLLIPLAPGIEDTEPIREKYFKIIIERLEHLTKQPLLEDIVFKESFCVNDFKEEYNSYKGNAYGLANTLLQTAFLRPKLKSKKVKNLYFTGQLTVPGPGVPPALISGKLVANLVV